MLTRSQTKTLLQKIFCELLLYFQVIFKSMKIADETFLGNSEWVKAQRKVVITLYYNCIAKQQQACGFSFSSALDLIFWNWQWDLLAALE